MERMSPTMQKASLNKLTVASFVLSLLFFTFIAAIMGHIALRQIKKTGQRGRALALAGVIIGWLGTILIVSLIAFVMSPFFSFT